MRGTRWVQHLMLQVFCSLQDIVHSVVAILCELVKCHLRLRSSIGMVSVYLRMRTDLVEVVMYLTAYSSASPVESRFENRQV